MGADYRIFSNLIIGGHELIPVPWLPWEKAESLPAYAARISRQIKEDNPILIGLSLGGMLAVEIGKMRPAQKIFLVSSAKASSELPTIGSYKFIHLLAKMIPGWVFIQPGPISYKYAGAQSADDRKILAAMMRDTDSSFVSRAMNAVLSWNNDTWPPDVIHIHGSADITIPPANINADYWIKGGTHIMIYNRAQEVGKIITACLQQQVNLQ